MGMFFEMLNSINDPHCQGSVGQLDHIILEIEQLQRQQQLDTDTTQTIMSAISRPMQSALRQGTTHNTDFSSLAQADLSALPTVFTPPIQAEIVQAIVQQTTIADDIIQTIVPSLLPLACQFFQMGASQVGSNHHSSNHVVAAFLKGDQFGRNDLGYIWRLARRFLDPELDR